MRPRNQILATAYRPFAAIGMLGSNVSNGSEAVCLMNLARQLHSSIEPPIIAPCVSLFIDAAVARSFLAQSVDMSHFRASAAPLVRLNSVMHYLTIALAVSYH
jgi:hypothetical protein